MARRCCRCRCSSSPGQSLVQSVFGRVGHVAATAGDYGSGQVTNTSVVVGASVQDALDTLHAAAVAAQAAAAAAQVAANAAQADATQALAEAAAAQADATQALANAAAALVAAQNAASDATQALMDAAAAQVDATQALADAAAALAAADAAQLDATAALADAAAALAAANAAQIDATQALADAAAALGVANAAQADATQALADAAAAQTSANAAQGDATQALADAAAALAAANAAQADATQALSGSLLTATAQPAIYPNSRMLQAGAGLSLVDGGPGNNLTINAVATVAPGTQRFADVALAAENILSTRTINAATRDASMYGQVNLGSESLAGKGTENNYATIGGGIDNLASGLAATIAGGEMNTASAPHTALGGGQENQASGSHAFIGGGGGPGVGNTATAPNAVVCGGSDNDATATHAVVVGGGRCANAADYAFIGAGNSNSIGAGGVEAFIGAGNNNQILGRAGAVAAGTSNTVLGARGFIGGGTGNLVGLEAVVAGGNTNTAGGDNSTVVGGFGCSAAGGSSAVGGGRNNDIAAPGTYGSIPGGRDNAVNDRDGHAWGRGATVNHEGACVMNFAGANTQASSANNEATLRADGGVRLITNGAKLTERLGTSLNNFAEQIQGQQSTTDATPAGVALCTVPLNGDVTVTVTLKGKQASSANCKSLYYVATYTNSGGVVALTGAAHINSIQATGGAAWSVAVGINGTTLELRFTGAAATTVRWTWDCRVHYGGQA